MIDASRKTALLLAIAGISLADARAAAAPPVVAAAPVLPSGVCDALASTPTGTVDAFDRFSPFFETVLGGLLLEVRASVDVQPLVQSLGVTSRVARCEGEAQDVWLPGVRDPDQASRALAAAAVKAGARLEVARWVAFGASTSIERLKAVCRSAEACAALARRIPPDERCAILLVHLAGRHTPPDALDRCEALPEEVTRCAAPALVSSVPALRDACVASVNARLRRP